MSRPNSWNRHSYPVQTPLKDTSPLSGSRTTSTINEDRNQPLPRNIRAVKDPDNYRHKGRNLVICLDGTGDKFDSDNSNIVHLVSCLKKDDPSQVTYYQVSLISGIGTYGAGGLSNGISAAADMAVGSGLGVHIQDAYRFLMQTYREGDKICLFGFSRGAYTARCLAGMLHKVGLLPAHNIAQLPFAYQFYKDDTDEGWEFSADFKKTFSIDCAVYFVGVFDCVASVGFIPRKLPFSSTPTSRTGHFRHAMALDEHRAKFKISRWQRIGTKSEQDNDARVIAEDAKEKGRGNVLRRASTILSPKQSGKETPRMNGKPPGAPNGRPQHSKKVESNAERQLREATGKAYRQSDVLEVWFLGGHADVGGGAVKNEVRHKLSQVPLRWMIRQAFECDTGILFNVAALAEAGLDVHTLWPLYKRQQKPVVGPSPGMMDKYEQGLLGPIQDRSSHYDTFDHEDEKYIDDDDEVEKLRLADQALVDGTKRAPIGEWTDELVEDYFDAMAPVNDQLVQAKGWWILELWPIKVRVQPRGKDWMKKVAMNLGRFRAVQDTDPLMHWTVRHRMAEKGYKLRTRNDRDAVWSTVV